MIAHHYPNFKRSHTTLTLNNRTPTPQTAIAHNPLILNDRYFNLLLNSDRSQTPNFKRSLF
ncbi:hypothetical protein [Dolichospermum circinale]|uniref:hypothetical protein n=1 Tax=Dolichospermum circinale TaxID=109265 RepID=UPI00232C015E|nr:hypothetical protein [Dolichospermum circinale]MDB9466401.1 hypothetical protein [Dolichospermum circinale CS-539/09]MDB9470027.1 hypothetical protein [Dolichospermum circinale CS-539]